MTGAERSATASAAVAASEGSADAVQPEPASDEVRDRPLSIVFFMRHVLYTRNFESTLRLLAERGHRVHVAFDHDVTNRQDRGQTVEPELIDCLAREYEGITYGTGPWREERSSRKRHGWLALEARLGLWTDYLRYLEPRYRDAPKLRERAEQKAGEGISGIARWPLLRGPRGLEALRRLLMFAERSVPTRAGVDRFLRDHSPDMVLVTPLVDLASSQATYVRSAKALGLRTALCVHSWDNLTNKGLIRDSPDLVTVWNEPQRREAIDLHRVPAERVLVTGAPGYDHWFGWAPSRDRQAFCRHVGLSPERAFLLYLCSSFFIAPHEADFVQEWIGQLREQRASQDLSAAGVLIRPHPKNVEQWREVDLSRFENVAVWPRAGANPLDPQSKADYFDSMHHCAAVVGVNTSGMIESAIIGRPVHTLLAEDFRETQEGTLHFEHLTSAGGGMLRVAASFEEHAGQLADALGDGGDQEGPRRFVETFVRPRGLGTAATPVLVDAIERACAGPAPTPRVQPLAARVLAGLLAPVAFWIEAHPRTAPRRLRKRARRARWQALAAAGLARRRVQRAIGRLRS